MLFNLRYGDPSRHSANADASLALRLAHKRNDLYLWQFLGCSLGTCNFCVLHRVEHAALRRCRRDRSKLILTFDQMFR